MEPLETPLSLEEIMELLEVQAITGKPRQLERLRMWIETLIESHGEAYVRENRRKLRGQWEQHLKDKLKSCC